MRSSVCTPEFDERTRELQDRIDKLRAELKATQRDAVRQTQLEKQSSVYREQLRSGEATRTGAKPKYEYNEKTKQAEIARDRLKRQVDELIARGDRMNRSAGKKVLSAVHDIQMASLLASWHVFKKLGYAVGGGHGMSLMADASRSLARQIPAIRRIADQAPQYGRGVDKDALIARWQGLKEAPREALNQLKHGEATRELLGGLGKVSDEYFTFAGTLADAIRTPGALNKVAETTRALAGYVGRTHAAEKEFLAQPEFREGIARQSKFLVNSLEKSGKTPAQIAEFMGRESTQVALATKALERAYESKMQGKNPFSSSVDALVGTLDRSDNAGANFLGFAIKTIFPVRKVGVNVAKQGTSLMLGGAKALVAAFKKGEMTPERADYIMKNIGQQGAGAALLVIGALYYTKFGGIPGVFSKKDQQKQVDLEEATIAPGASEGFGAEAFHGAPASMLQIGASMNQIFQKKYGKENGLDMTLDVALKPTLNWLERTIPYSEQARRWSNTLQYGRARTGGLTAGLGEIAGNTARGMIVPGVVQQYAQAQDPYKGFRRPRSAAEDIKLGIPGLRETVPQPEPKRKN